MKRRIFTVIIVVLTLCLTLSACSFGNDNDDYLRIHIRANSNSQQDQNVKYLVKNAVVDYLTPLLCNAKDKDAAKQIVIANKDGIQRVADSVLKQNVFYYTSNAVVKQEEFPTRTYEGLTLDSGVYEALIVNLGTGTGDNWWCVVYPPLCFVGGEATTGNTIKYKSKLLEIINDFLGKN